MNFVISLTDKEVDYLATVLSQRPWAEVNALLANIGNQLARQREPQTPEFPVEGVATVRAPRTMNGHAE